MTFLVSCPGALALLENLTVATLLDHFFHFRIVVALVSGSLPNAIQKSVSCRADSICFGGLECHATLPSRPAQMNMAMRFEPP